MFKIEVTEDLKTRKYLKFYSKYENYTQTKTLPIRLV